MEPAPLRDRVIAIPETREVEIFAAMLERRGATVIRCPMVAIRDAPDPEPILRWSRELAQGRYDDLILLTGEGLRRILSCLERHDTALGHGAAPGHDAVGHDAVGQGSAAGNDGMLRARFVEALAKVRKITRGPKPARALRELGLKPDIAAVTPTTEGVIESLRAHDLRGRRVGVQLYGTEPNRPLVEFLEGAGASVSVVAPYVYADAADDRAVLQLLDRLNAKEVDAIAFTSTPQVERLFAVAPESTVRSALEKTVVAAVGPVVAETLQKHGIHARVMPEESFFLKPLTSVLEEAFTTAS
ncbi:MAG TPA: uroporphyrinogen-III synthase [Steroidobacteraceae bacterium]|nr:uroporphyrinogen-III synthase [Steroidobacteraceae bacterium]